MSIMKSNKAVASYDDVNTRFSFHVTQKVLCRLAISIIGSWDTCQLDDSNVLYSYYLYSQNAISHFSHFDSDIVNI